MDIPTSLNLSMTSVGTNSVSLSRVLTKFPLILLLSNADFLVLAAMPEAKFTLGTNYNPSRRNNAPPNSSPEVAYGYRVICGSIDVCQSNQNRVFDVFVSEPEFIYCLGMRIL